MSVVPIRNKTGATVTQAFRDRILPGLPKLPTKILTDNGNEFRCKELNDVLSSFNIKHIYSTPYQPASNGSTERSNRSIIQMLKGVLQDDVTNWDRKIHKVVIIYNSTIHSQTGFSPSALILEQAHAFQEKLPIEQSTSQTWRAGNPKFSPYQVHQKVVYKIQRKGRLVTDKLKQRYEGPFQVLKIMPNNVSYQIQRLDSPSGRVIRAHYDQLRLFHEPPEYLKGYITSEVVIDGTRPSSSSDSSDFGECVPQINDEVEIVPWEQDKTAVCPAGHGVLSPKPKGPEPIPTHGSAQEVNPQNCKPGAKNMSLRNQSKAPRAKQLSCDSLGFSKTFGSLKLMLEPENESVVGAGEKHDSSASVSPIKPVSEILGKLNFKEVPLDMLYCSEIVEGNNNRKRAMSTPHPTAQRRAQFWSLSDATVFQEVSSSGSESSLMEVLALISSTNDKLKEVSAVIKTEFIPSDGIQPMQEQAAALPDSPNSFEGFSSNGMDEAGRKLVRLAEEFQVEYAKLQNSITPQNLVSSIEALETMIPRDNSASDDSGGLENFRRLTRSRGAPLVVPNVQPLILERRRRRCSTSDIKG